MPPPVTAIMATVILHPRQTIATCYNKTMPFRPVCYRETSMKSKLLVMAALLAAASLTSPARADNISLNFSGGGVFTAIALILPPEPEYRPARHLSPNPMILWAPMSLIASLGFFRTLNPIAACPERERRDPGLVAISPENPAEMDNYLAPHSFSAYPVPNFPPHNRFTYDNLLYPGGNSPQSASSYPPMAGILTSMDCCSRSQAVTWWICGVPAISGTAQPMAWV